MHLPKPCCFMFGALDERRSGIWNVIRSMSDAELTNRCENLSQDFSVSDFI